MMNADKKKNNFPSPRPLNRLHQTKNLCGNTSVLVSLHSTPRLPHGCKPRANWGAKLKPWALLCA